MGLRSNVTASKASADGKHLNPQLDGKMVNGKWVTKTDVNYKNDKSATGDWGNEYGPSPDFSAQKKKHEPMPAHDTEHVDGKTKTDDWRAEYENNQTKTKWTGKVGDTHYYDSAYSYSTITTLGVAVLCLTQ